MKKTFLTKLAVYMFVFAAGTAIAEVTVNVTHNAGNKTTPAKIEFKNNTSSIWRFGGVRFKNTGYAWKKVTHPLGENFVTVNESNGEQNLIVLSSKSMTTLGAGGSASWNHTSLWDGKDFSGLKPEDGSIELLLRTGAPGIPDEPKVADPITIEELEELIKEPDFYNKDYRYIDEAGRHYYDSLGAMGGRYGGGFMNTYFGQTQLHFAIPNKVIPKLVNNTDAKFSLGENMPHYYIALAMAQEYFNFDAKWLAAQGAKETLLGVGSAGIGKVVSGYGSWQIEEPSFIGRAVVYPQFYPKYEQYLSGSGGSVSGPSEIPTYYMYGTKSGTANSALVFNGMFVSLLFQYACYDVFSYSASVCWRGLLANAADPYLTFAIIATQYNKGINSDAGPARLAGQEGGFGWLNPNNIDNVINDPDAKSKVIPASESNYYLPILPVIQHLEAASKNFELGDGLNSEAIDFKINLQLLRDMFFGDGGTVENQGDGGVLLHYYDPSISGSNYKVVRQRIWDTLEEAFNLLKGKAPSADANTVSYRYDLLSILRTVKKDVPFNRSFQFVGELAGVITKGSSGSFSTACPDAVANDDIYPYAELTVSPDEEECLVYVDMTDENKCGKVTWTIDRNWANWNNAVMTESAPAAKNKFTITVDNSIASSGDTVWIMAEDAAGNSVVKKAELQFKAIPKMKGAGIFDTSNPADGYPDIIKAEIKNQGNAKNAKYSFSWGTLINEEIPVNAITTNGDSIFFDISNFDSEDGAGNGKDFLYLEYFDEIEGADKKDSIDITDLCGPAILKADFYPNQDSDSKPDTLKIELTEPSIISELGGIELLKFKDKTDNETAIFDLGGDYITFLYEKGKLTDNNEVLAYDSVKINAYDLFSDAKSNNALEINQWVKITDRSKPSLLPEIISAEIFDTWGKQNGRLDGQGDSLFVKLKLSEETNAYTTGKIDSVKFDFGGKQYNEKTINIVSDTEFYILDKTIIGGFGTGSLTLFFTDEEGNIESVELNDIIKDKIAPVIASASYTRYDGRADTLKIMYSEEILTGGTSEIAVDNNRTYTLDFVKAVTVTDSEVIDVYAVTNGNFERGDSIWLKINNGITDMERNEQVSENNQHVEISYTRFSSFTLENAAYFDTNSIADGYIDLINVEYKFGSDIEISDEEIKKIADKITLPKSREFTVNNISVKGNLIEIKVSQDKNSILPKTDVDANDKISLSHTVKISDEIEISANSNIQISDKIAPVITRAVFEPMEIKNDTDKIIDTLKLWFSEPLKDFVRKDALGLKSKEKFEFNDAGINDAYIAIPIEYNEASSYLPINCQDSIRIEGGFEITDAKDIMQEVNTVFVPLEVGKYKQDYEILVFPNPYNLTKDDKLTIMVRPIKSRGDEKDLALSGKVAILDAIGNSIINPEKFNADGKNLIWSWKGKNSRKRNIGAGTYQAIIEIINEVDNDKKVYLKQIGIKN